MKEKLLLSADGVFLVALIIENNILIDLLIFRNWDRASS